MKSLGNHGPFHPSGQNRPDGRNGDARSGVVGNERMTTLAGALLLVLILVELVSTANLGGLLSVHIFIGVLLAGPLAVKIASTGYRFVRYYTRSPAFMRKGPPLLALRVLAPLLLATTLLLIGSGIGLVLIGPAQAGPLLAVHAISTLIWLPMIAIHVVAYIRQVPHSLADDWRKQSAEQAPGRGLRLGVNLGALMGGVLAGIVVLPLATPWINETNGKGPAGPFIVGLFVAIFVVLATRPFRWK